MRMGEFLDYMADYNFLQAQSLALNPGLGGGWEVWLQIELLRHLRSKDVSWQMKRGRRYPGTGEKCDFFVEHGGGRDPAYIELKCQFSKREGNSVQDVLNRFKKDLDKQGEYPGLAGFCLLACNGKWGDGHITQFNSITSGCTRYVLHADPVTGASMGISSLNDGNIRGHMEQNNFFLIGATYTRDDPPVVLPARV